MKVCAHMTLGPFNTVYQRFSSMKEAGEYFKGRVAGVDFGTGTTEQVMDLYPRCDECKTGMCFHDYPMARLQVVDDTVKRVF